MVMLILSGFSLLWLVLLSKKMLFFGEEKRLKIGERLVLRGGSFSKKSSSNVMVRGSRICYYIVSGGNCCWRFLL